MNRVVELKEHIASAVTKVREQQRFDDIWEWRVAENMAGEVAEQLTLFGDTVKDVAALNTEAVRLIDQAMKARPMQRAGALKKARAAAAKAARGATTIAEAV